VNWTAARVTKMVRSERTGAAGGDAADMTGPRGAGARRNPAALSFGD